METSAKAALKQTRCSPLFRFKSFWRATVGIDVASKAPGCRHQRRLGQDPPSDMYSACRADAIATRPDFRGHRHAEETRSRMTASSLSLVILRAKRQTEACPRRRCSALSGWAWLVSTIFGRCECATPAPECNACNRVDTNVRMTTGRVPTMPSK